ncbi:MAG: glutamyl-tRNA reductase [Bacillota bacterium]
MLEVAGVSCHTAPLALREKLAVCAEEYPRLLRELALSPAVGEAAILATCNRTEVYLVRHRARLGAGPVSDGAGGGGPCSGVAWQFFVGRGLGAGEEQLLYRKEGETCVRHLFSVACGLDSPVLGETQVLGQVREALTRAREAGTAGPVLNALFERAVATAGLVHSRTGLGSHACSASSAAVEAISAELGGLGGCRVLLVGAGKMAELAGRALRGRGAEVWVTSRNLGRAAAVAHRHGLTAVPWTELEERLGQADAVISGTGAPHLILGRERVARALAVRRERQCSREGSASTSASRPAGGARLVVADLAMPRDVDPDVAGLPGVRLFDLDELQARARANLEHRRALAGEAQGIIEGEVARFQRWLAARQAVALIRAVRGRYQAMARREVEWALARMGPLTLEQRRVLEEMVQRLVNKGLHGPIKAMGRGAGDREGEWRLAVLAEALLAPGTREARGVACRGRTGE